MDPDRRKVVKAVTVGIVSAIGAGVVGGFTGGVGRKVFNTIFPSDKGVVEADREALEVLFGGTDELPSIFAGAGNLQGAAVGINNTSVYLSYSAEKFTNYITKVMRPVLNVVESNEGNEFIYDHRKSSLFLGGPPANEITSKLLGYSRVSLSCDGGKRLFARRFSSSTGKEVERPVFKMIDKNSGELFVPRIDQGYLASEWLSIIRLKEGKKHTVVIGGMHGYSTEAFCKYITRNIEHLKNIVGEYEQFQVVVPVSLAHRKDNLGTTYTSGEINWEHALYEQIFV